MRLVIARLQYVGSSMQLLFFAEGPDAERMDESNKWFVVGESVASVVHAPDAVPDVANAQVAAPYPATLPPPG